MDGGVMPYSRGGRAEMFVGQKHPERGRGVGPFVVRMDVFDGDGKHKSTRKAERPTMELAQSTARSWKAEAHAQGMLTVEAGARG
jgi:hypothetical protein